MRKYGTILYYSWLYPDGYIRGRKNVTENRENIENTLKIIEDRETKNRANINFV